MEKMIIVKFDNFKMQILNLKKRSFYFSKLLRNFANIGGHFGKHYNKSKLYCKIDT